MNQERRQKKQARYKVHLNKRFGYTKALKWREIGQSGIENKTGKPLLNEFVLTRRKDGRIVSKQIQKWEWSREALAVKKQVEADRKLRKELFASTKKNHRNSTCRLKAFLSVLRHFHQPVIQLTTEEKKVLKNALKQAREAKREYHMTLPSSDKHLKLINDAYSNQRANEIFKQQIRKAAHEARLKAIAEKLYNYKMSRLINLQTRKAFKVVIGTINTPDFLVRYSNLSKPELIEIAKKLHAQFSENMKTYSSITIIEQHTGEHIEYRNPNLIEQRLSA